MAPSLPPWVCFLWGFPFSALEVPRGDHTLKDSQQSVVHHDQPLTGTNPRTGKMTGLPRRAVQSQQHSQVTPECAHVAAGVFPRGRVPPVLFLCVGLLQLLCHGYSPSSGVGVPSGRFPGFLLFVLVLLFLVASCG